MTSISTITVESEAYTEEKGTPDVQASEGMTERARGKILISTISVTPYLPGCMATTEKFANSWVVIGEKLRGLGELSDDWDGLGAVAPSGAVIESAFEFLKMLQLNGLAPPLVVSAGPDGTILFTWQHGLGHLSAEIDRPGHAEWMQINPDAPGNHWEWKWQPRAHPESWLWERTSGPTIIGMPFWEFMQPATQ